MLGLVVVMTGCGSEESARRPEPEALTAARAQEALAEEGPTGEGRMPGGTFRFGGLFDSSELKTGGRLSSASWDIYWHRNDGARGAWGVGIDILSSPEVADPSARRRGRILVPGPRRGVEALESRDVGDVRAVSCRRGGGDGFYATLDAADGPVLTSVTVAGPTRSAAVADSPRRVAGGRRRSGPGARVAGLTTSGCSRTALRSRACRCLSLDAQPS